MYIGRQFDGFLCKDDILQCKALPNGKENPLVYLFTQEVIDSSNSFGYTKCNVVSAFSIIKSLDNDWLNKNKYRLLDGIDIKNATAALGELCCYGYLLSAFGKDCVNVIKPQSTPTPDFCVYNGNGERVYVEVNAIQINGDEYEALREFDSSKDCSTNQGIIIREHSIVPFGSKNANCVAENVIHRLCQIKNDEKQIDKENPSILWVDLQEQHVNALYKRSFSSCPILTSNGMIYSNELWYALYGEIGMPIYENYDPIYHDYKNVPLMQHHGRFHSNYHTKIDAVVFCFPCATIIYQNPNSYKPLPEWFLKKMFFIRWFNFQGSKTNYPSNTLVEQLSIDKSIVFSLCNKDKPVSNNDRVEN